MVPLRSEFGAGKTSTWNETRPRTHLVLCDTTKDIAAPAAAAAPRSRKSLRRWDSLLFGITVASVLLFFVLTFFGFLWHSAATSYQSSFAPTAPVITRRVASGDTLWRYAAQYGDPNSYILDRVETIARDNHLSSDTPLVPGQVLQIAVHNPTVIAQIERHHHSRLAALPRP